MFNWNVYFSIKKNLNNIKPYDWYCPRLNLNVERSVYSREKSNLQVILKKEPHQKDAMSVVNCQRMRKLSCKNMF